ncbi:hypothetical protein CR513_40499, partial [Mucuna pruriens]
MESPFQPIDSKHFPLYWQQTSSFEGCPLKVLSPENKTWISFLDALPRDMNCETLVNIASGPNANTQFKSFLRDQNFNNFRPLLTRVGTLIKSRLEKISEGEGSLQKSTTSDVIQVPTPALPPPEPADNTDVHPSGDLLPDFESLSAGLVSFNAPSTSDSLWGAGVEDLGLLPSDFIRPHDRQLLSSAGLQASFDMVSTYHARSLAILQAWRGEAQEFEQIKSQAVASQLELSQIRKERMALVFARSEIASIKAKNILLQRNLVEMRADRNSLHVKVIRQEGLLDLERVYSTKLADTLDDAWDERNRAERRAAQAELDMSTAHARVETLLSEVARSERPPSILPLYKMQRRGSNFGTKIKRTNVNVLMEEISLKIRDGDPRTKGAPIKRPVLEWRRHLGRGGLLAGRAKEGRRKREERRKRRRKKKG